MTTPEMLINRKKTVTAVVMAFAKGNRHGYGNERMLITKYANTSHTQPRQLELCETIIKPGESPVEAGLRCANKRLWLFEDEALQPQDLKYVGLLEWLEHQQFVFQIGFLVPHKFIKNISETDYLPLDNLLDHWDRLSPSSASVLNGLPQITTLHQTTQSFFGGASEHA